MGPAMEIDILEVRKGKKYYALIFNPKMSIPFVNGVKLPTNLLSIKISIYFAHICGVIVEKLKGESEKGEILAVFKLEYLQKKSPK